MRPGMKIFEVIEKTHSLAIGLLETAETVLLVVLAAIVLPLVLLVFRIKDRRNVDGRRQVRRSL